MLEIWKDIKGFEENYQVSNTGKVRSKDRVIIYSNLKKFTYKSKELKQLTDRYGYKRVNLYNSEKKMKTFTIHRLVAIHFIPNPLNLPQVNHIDGNKFNNSYQNLEWSTVMDNLKHSYDNNLKKIKLSRDDVNKIKELYSSGNYTQKEIGNMFNVYKEHISNIITGKKRKIN